MLDFGSVVLTRFPFTDLTGNKLRPALVISRDNERRSDLVLAFITSNTQMAASPDALPLTPSRANGLKVPSVIRFDKVATLESRVIVGQLGTAEATFLAAARPVFFRVFGFGEP
jgi:mRNA interferase MazF